MVAHREHVEPQPFVPEAARMGNHAKSVPEIHAALGQYTGIVGDPLLRPTHQRRGNVEATAAAQGFVEVEPHEQPFQPGDVIQVRVGQEQCARRCTVAMQISGERFLPAVDHQDRFAVVLEHRAGGTKLHRGGVSNTEEMQGMTHGAARIAAS
jgi:hypothetical protein